jgi:hypothetical protein
MSKKIIVAIACFAAVLKVAAQPGNNIVVTDTYNPQLVDANKYYENPKVTDSVPKQPVLDYTTIQSQYKTGFELDPIKAATIKGQGLEKLYRAHAKVGFGNYTTPYGELWVNSLRSKTMSLGLHYMHLSSTGKIKDRGHAGYSTNDLDLYGKSFVGKHTLSGDLYYHRNARHYYGYNPSEFNLSKDDVLQYFNHIGINLGGESNYVGDSSRIHHKIDMKYYYLADRFKTTENFFDIGGKAWFNNNNLSYGGALNFDYIRNLNNNDQLQDTVNTYLLTIKPFFRAQGDKYMVRAGVNAFLNVQDTNTRFYFHPTIEASFNLYQDYLIVFAGINGDFKRNTFLGLTTQNMFMNTNASIQNSNHKLQINGGLKGALSKSTSFKIDVNRQMVDNMPLFVNDTAVGPRNTFFMVYDTVRVFNVNGELAFAKGDKFTLAARGEFYSYKPRNEAKAWHLPNFRVAINGRYNIADKILVKADVYVVGTRYARVFSLDSLGLPVTPLIAKELKPYVDANLGIEYRYNKALSAFLNINNIAARRYERYYGYPSQRINFILGISYSL